MIERVRAALSDDLRRAPWKGCPNPLTGHCYVASEALFHLLGGKLAGWTPCFLRHEGQPHWFLRHVDGQVLDPTAGQFTATPDYSLGTGKGFLTRSPSRRAQQVINQARST